MVLTEFMMSILTQRSIRILVFPVLVGRGKGNKRPATTAKTGDKKEFQLIETGAPTVSLSVFHLCNNEKEKN